MKFLFITHDIGLYGASRSLGLTIKSLIRSNFLSRDNIFLAYNFVSLTVLKNILNGKNGDTFFPNKILGNIKNIYRGVFPFSLHYKGSPKTIFHRVGSILLFPMFTAYWILAGKRIIKMNRIDHVYLNSVVLWPVLLFIPKNIKSIIHVREVLKNGRTGFYKRLISKIILTKADTIIAIDKKSSQPFAGSPKLRIIKNPFDMRKSKALRKEKPFLLKKYKIPERRKNIALIGSISENKGQDFFLNIARNFDNKDLFNFIIVGKVRTKLSKRIQLQSTLIKNTFYLGEVSKIEEIYAITDIIIRCENYYALGRTAWEAYYSGCEAILIPLNKNENLRKVATNSKLEKGFIYYKSRDIKDVCSKLQMLSKKIDKTNSNPDNNIKEFHNSFINAILYSNTAITPFFLE